MRKLFLKALSCVMALSAGISCLHAFADTEQIYTATAAHLLTLKPQTGSVGGDWVTLGLSRAGEIGADRKEAYAKAVEEYVGGIGSEKLNSRRSTDNSRVILGLSAAGYDARSAAGYDLTSPLRNTTYVAKQGINGAIWALIALDSCQYPCDSRAELIELIVGAQHSDGGWGLDESISDPDMTAMALTALAPYRFYDTAVRTAVENGVALLVNMQRENGGYSSYDDFNPESCAQVIVALCAVEIDCAHDLRFCKSGRTLFDSIERFAVDGGFTHTAGGEYNQLATEQVFYALTAYRRFQAKQTALFDMTDVNSFAFYDLDGDGRETINDVTHLQRYLAEFDVRFSTPQKRLADLNGNHRVDVSDVTQYQRKLADG